MEKTKKRETTGKINKRKNRNESGKSRGAGVVVFVASIMILTSMVFLPSLGIYSGVSPIVHNEVTNSVNSGPGSISGYQMSPTGNHAGVNPYQYYQNEPAPVGISDFGIGRNGSPYFYNTSAFEGKVNIIRLELNGTAGGTLPNAVVNGSGNVVVPIGEELGNQLGMTMQLNVQFSFIISLCCFARSICIIPCSKECAD